MYCLCPQVYIKCPRNHYQAGCKEVGVAKKLGHREDEGGVPRLKFMIYARQVNGKLQVLGLGPVKPDLNRLGMRNGNQEG